MPFLGFLGNMLSGQGGTAMAEGLAGWLQGRQQAQQAQTQQGLTLLQLLHQQQQDQENAAYRRLQTSNLQSEIDQRKFTQDQTTARNKTAWLTMEAQDPQHKYHTAAPFDVNETYAQDLPAFNQAMAADRKDLLGRRGWYNVVTREFAKSKALPRDATGKVLDFNPDDPTNWEGVYNAEKATQQQLASAAQANATQAAIAARTPTLVFPGNVNMNGMPAAVNKFTGVAQPIANTQRTQPGAGANAGKFTASSENMQRSLNTMQDQLTKLQTLHIAPTMLQQQRIALGTPSGPQSISDMFQRKALDAVNQGPGSPGYAEFQRMMNLSSQFADEATRLYGQRGGYRQMQKEIDNARINADDINNPGLIQDKFDRMKTLVAKARQLEAVQGWGTPAAPAGGGTPAGVPSYEQWKASQQRPGGTP